MEPGFIMATVVAKNLHGKQHTASQRAMIANSLLPFYQAEAKERQKLSEGRGAKGVQKVAPVKAREAAGKAAGKGGGGTGRCQETVKKDRRGRKKAKRDWRGIKAGKGFAWDLQKSARGGT